MRVTTLVSFSAFTRKFLSFHISSGSSAKSISRRRGRSRLSTLCSSRLRRDSGSAIAIVGPDLYSVVTMLSRSEVSCSFHVESLPLLLSEVQVHMSKFKDASVVLQISEVLGNGKDGSCLRETHRRENA